MKRHGFLWRQRPKLSGRERDYICAALHYLSTSGLDGSSGDVGSTSWSSFLVHAHLDADGIRPLTPRMVERLIARLERVKL